MTVTIVPAEEILKFIKDQPDARQVRHGENRGSDPVGNVLVHFAKSIGIKDPHVGFTLLQRNANGDELRIHESFTTYSLALYTRVLTDYKSVKSLIAKIKPVTP